MGYAEDLQRAEQNLAAASAFHANAVNAAFVVVQQAEQGYWARVQAFEAEASGISDAYAEGLSTCAGVTLYPDRVSNGETTVSLMPGVLASVEIGGNVDYGSDRRTLSITIDFPNGQRIAVMGDPKKEGEARAFAALVMNTAAELDGPPPTLEEELARVRRDLDDVRADTSELDAARAAYEAAYYDTAAVQAAQQALDELRARAPRGFVGRQEGGSPVSYVPDIQLAEQNLAAANAVHANAVNVAFAAMQQAEQGYWGRIQTIQAELEGIRDSFEEGLSSCAGITLFPDRVSDGETTAPLQQGINASVATGGSMSYPAMDTRTLSITIDFPNGQRIAAMGDPDKEGEARAFAALVMNAAAKLDGAPPNPDQKLARLQCELDAARADTRELDAARAAYEAAYYDTAAVWAAQRHLDDVLSRTPEEELAAIEDARQSRLLRHRVIAIVTTLVLVVLGIAFVVIFSWALL